MVFKSIQTFKVRALCQIVLGNIFRLRSPPRNRYFHVFMKTAVADTTLLSKFDLFLQTVFGIVQSSYLTKANILWYNKIKLIESWVGCIDVITIPINAMLLKCWFIIFRRHLEHFVLIKHKHKFIYPVMKTGRVSDKWHYVRNWKVYFIKLILR